MIEAPVRKCRNQECGFEFAVIQTASSCQLGYVPTFCPICMTSADMVRSMVLMISDLGWTNPVIEGTRVRKLLDPGEKTA